MSGLGTCKLPSCDNEPRGREPGLTLYEGKFCSTGCEMKHDHLEDDARDARRSELTREGF